jgi:hypothetical protein
VEEPSASAFNQPEVGIQIQIQADNPTVPTSGALGFGGGCGCVYRVSSISSVGCKFQTTSGGAFSCRLACICLASSLVVPCLSGVPGVMPGALSQTSGGAQIGAPAFFLRLSAGCQCSFALPPRLQARSLFHNR